MKKKEKTKEILNDIIECQTRILNDIIERPAKIIIAIILITVTVLLLESSQVYAAMTNHFNITTTHFTVATPEVTMSETSKLAATQSDNTITDDMLYARSAVLMDAESGRILYGKEENEIMPMASTTKIMTLIVTLENANLEDIVTVSQYAASMPDVQLNIREGEQYYLKDLVYSMMLESHNDSAVAIAEHVGGDIEHFSKMMNEKAKKIGCRDSFFITPNGLDATATVTARDGLQQEVIHGTTATELAKIMSYCILRSPKKEEFVKITQTRSYSFTDIESKRNFSCNNHNALLGMMEGAISGKTGFTGKAGYCYVGAVESEGRIFTVALLACGWPSNKGHKWKDMRKLIGYGCNAFHREEFDEKKLLANIPLTITIENGQTKKLGERAKCDLTLIKENACTDCKGVLLKEEEEISEKLLIKKNLTAPAKKGEKIGMTYFCVGDEKYDQYAILLSGDVPAIDYQWCLKQVFILWYK